MSTYLDQIEFVCYLFKYKYVSIISNDIDMIFTIFYEIAFSFTLFC